jgi:hypothetical protein
MGREYHKAKNVERLSARSKSSAVGVLRALAILY